MAAITIRQLSDADKQRLRERAAANGRSMEAEAREILRAGLALGTEDVPKPMRADLSWTDAFIEFGRLLGGEEIDLPPRTPMRWVDFEEA
jgi:plasmid stability protein